MKKKRKPNELNENHVLIINFVLDYEAEKGRKPKMYEICYGLDKTPKAISKALSNAIPGYPKELMISPIQYERSHRFEKGMTVVEFAEACGVSKETIYSRKEEYDLIGIEFRMERGKYKSNPFKLDRRINHDASAKEVYIKVTHGSFKGARGYLEPFTDVANAILWINGEQVPARLETCEYREVRKAI